MVAYVPQAEEVDWNFPVLVEDVVMMGRYGPHELAAHSLRPPIARWSTPALERVGNLGPAQATDLANCPAASENASSWRRALAQEGRVILLDEPFTECGRQHPRKPSPTLGVARRVARRGPHTCWSPPTISAACRNSVTVPSSSTAASLLQAPRMRSSPEKNLDLTFGGALRHFELGGAYLHDDARDRHAHRHGAHRRRETLRSFTATRRIRRRDPPWNAGARQGRRDVSLLAEPFSYSYMVNAMWVSALVGAVCAFLSAYLMLKGWSLIGDALSHSIVPGVAGAYMLGLPFAVGAFFSGGLAAAAMLFLSQATRLREDAVIGLIFTSFFGLGLFMISISPVSVNVQTIVLGNILAITPGRHDPAGHHLGPCRWPSFSPNGRT